VATASSTAASVAAGYFDAVAARDVEAMASFWEPGGIDELHGLASLRAPDQVREWFGNVFRAMPDIRMEVLEILAGEERAAVHWHMTGTFDGEGRFEGLIANGARVDITGCDVLTVRDGKIARNDAYLNGAEMARQLGALPPQGSLAEGGLSAVLNLRTRAARALGR
jgi:steroid delta-isomerase-like uncharacterized protein